MFCFKDRTFCSFEDCKNFKKCNRAYNAKMKEQNKDNMPVCFWKDKPECYEEKENELP